MPDDYHDIASYIASCEAQRKKALGAEDYEHLTGIERKNARNRTRYRLNKARESEKASERHFRKKEAGLLSTKEDLLRKRYGVSLETYKIMVEQQKGCCAICGDYKGESLGVDHDHVTGKVRGLLCSLCNLAVGNLRDNFKLAESAAAYIKRYSNCDR